MANVKRVYITGWAPFDITQHEGARGWLGILNGLSFGLEIVYSGQGLGPINENGGRTTYYRFEVQGEEAVRYSFTEAMVKDLVDAGCLVEEAREMDLEFDPNLMEWGAIEIPPHDRPDIQKGDPMLRLLMRQDPPENGSKNGGG